MARAFTVWVFQNNSTHVLAILTMLYIAQASEPPISAPPRSLSPAAEYGLLGVLVFAAVPVVAKAAKEMFGWFRTKDEAEAHLTNTLIQDLRETNRSLGQQQNSILLDLKGIQEQTSKTIEKLEHSLTVMTARYDQESQALKRDSTLMLVEVREQLILIKGQTEAIHRRMDEAEEKEKI